MNTLTDDELSAKRLAYQTATLHALHHAVHAAQPLSAPYVAHGCWYVRSGNVHIPFKTYEDALEWVREAVNV